MQTFDQALNVRSAGVSGSEFETTGQAVDALPRIEVADVGDFEPGQWVTVSRCHIHYPERHIHRKNKLGFSDKTSQAFDDLVECRGFDDSRTHWQSFLLHIEDTTPRTFRWLALDPVCQTNNRRWLWQGHNLPVKGDWQPLMDGVEIRFRNHNPESGQIVTFHARSRLVCRIKVIEGRGLILDQAPNRTVAGASVRHLDQAALQAALGQAVATKRALYIPAGRYRLLTGLQVTDASIRIEGESREHTILDISDGIGPVFTLRGGREVVIRNLAMVGHTGFNELPWYSLGGKIGWTFWPGWVKECQAARIAATEHVLFEDVSARRMATEAFYSGGPNRFSGNETAGDQMAVPDLSAASAPYTKSIIYNRCRVADCAANAFNNNDFAENTSILHCHVENVHNFWEGASRFQKVIGNYVKNAHCGSYGNIGGLRPQLLRLGSGQAIITDNVFEGGTFGQGIGIGGGGAATQVVVANNLFINFSNATAISISGLTSGARYPARSVTVTGNIIDLTHVEGQQDRERVGIAVSAGNVIVSNNQIYARGLVDPKVTGIQVSELAVNVLAHDNLIENCAYGFRTGLAFTVFTPETGAYAGDAQIRLIESAVHKVLSCSTFKEQGSRLNYWDTGLPAQWDFAAPYAGWNLRWLSGAHTGTTAQIADYDPHNRILTLLNPQAVRTGDRFAVFPRSANWQIHHNMIAGCQQPVVLDGFGSATSRFTDNLVSRGNARGVARAIQVKGRFDVVGNQLVDFNEPNARGIEPTEGEP